MSEGVGLKHSPSSVTGQQQHGASGGGDLLTVTVSKDEHGYGMKISGDNPVYVQSVKERGAAWRAGLRAGDRIVRVGHVNVQNASHTHVVQLIRANPNVLLTVCQTNQKLKSPTSITAPLPVDQEKQKQLEFTKVSTIRLMLENEQQHVDSLRAELSKGSNDQTKKQKLSAAEQRCQQLQNKIDIIMASMPAGEAQTPKSSRSKASNNNQHLTTGFLSGIPRSLSNLTGQSIRNLKQARQSFAASKNSDHIVKPDEGRKKQHNNTVPMVPVTCLDGIPPPLPPRTINQRRTMSPTGIPHLKHATKPFLSPPASAMQSPKDYHRGSPSRSSRSGLMERSYPAPKCRKLLPRSAHSLDETEHLPNSISTQLNYPLVAIPQPPLQTDIPSNIQAMHTRSQSSPEHLDQMIPYPSPTVDSWEPPPGTPPPPYSQPSNNASSPNETSLNISNNNNSISQRHIMSMEDDDDPEEETSMRPSLFSNLGRVRESKVKMAVLLNWLLGERRSANAALFLLLTDAYSKSGVNIETLRRWAYEIHSTFLIPDAALPITNVDERMAREIDDILITNCEKKEVLEVVFRKARAKAKDELTQQLQEFQVKRQVGLAMLYGPDDAVLEKCDSDKQQELVVVEQIICSRMQVEMSNAKSVEEGSSTFSRIAALQSAAINSLGVRAGQINAVMGATNTRATFLQRDKYYKQRVKAILKQQTQPFLVRGHQLIPVVITSAEYCQHCQNVISGFAPQAYLCSVSECGLRLHRNCWRLVEETCVADQSHNRISRLMDRLHGPGQDRDSEKKSKKGQAVSNFLNVERNARKNEEVSALDGSNHHHNTSQDPSDESMYESTDCTSASEDTLSKLKMPSASKESLKITVTDEENEVKLRKKGHRKTLSDNLDLKMLAEGKEKEFDKRKSKESLWSEDDAEKKKERRKSSSVMGAVQIARAGSVTALNILRRRKPTKNAVKAIEAVAEDIDRTSYKIINITQTFLEEEKRNSVIYPAVKLQKDMVAEDIVDTVDSVTSTSTMRRAGRTTSRNKSRVRGKSQTVKANPLKKSKSSSNTLKRKKKGMKTPTKGRSRNPSIVESTPVPKKKTVNRASWKFGSNKESKRDGSTEECSTGAEHNDSKGEGDKDESKIDGLWRSHQNSSSAAVPSKPVSRAESCREPVANNSRHRGGGKQRNASDPNRLTANRPNDAEAKAAVGAPSGSSSSTSLSSRSNESNTVPDEHQASESDWSGEEDVLAETWQTTVPADLPGSLTPSHRKRQELIHELITSENSHVRWLKVLQKEFLRPLGRKENAHLLSSDELKALFPNLPAVREKHTKLYLDLRSLRKDKDLVEIRTVSEAILNTLCEPTYASCLSKFCRNQRQALDALREKRRKSKELHAFLAQREQSPMCGRLQLRDLIACVWQRLTKYPILLESILKTISENEESEHADDVTKLRSAYETAKEVLHSVDSAIRNAENEHRLKSIQSKMVVQMSSNAPPDENEEMKKLDLTQKTLIYEGELFMGHEKQKTQFTALFLSDCLVLLQKEGDKYFLKHIQHTKQLSPIVFWNTVFFRPNAASKNTFFLANVKSLQIHELTANTSAEYNAWSKYCTEAPLADPRNAKTPSVVPSHRTHDNNGGVSRNPSDASRSSQEELPDDKSKQEQPPMERAHSEESAHEKRAVCEAKSTPVVLSEEMINPLEPASAVTIREPAKAEIPRQTYSTEETLRRLNASIVKALEAKSMIIGEILNIPENVYEEVSEMAVAETMGDADLKKDLKSVERSQSIEREPLRDDSIDLHQVLLAAQTQANQLTEIINAAMNLTQGDIISSRLSNNVTPNDTLCDKCHSKRRAKIERSVSVEQGGSFNTEISFDMLSDANSVTDEKCNQPSVADEQSHSETAVSSVGPAQLGCNTLGRSEPSAMLASRLAPVACGLQTSLAKLMTHIPQLLQNNDQCRRSLASRNDAIHSLLDKHLRRNDSVISESGVDQNSETNESAADDSIPK